MCTERSHGTRSGPLAFIAALCCLSVGLLGNQPDEVSKAPDCPEVELVAQALTTISSKNWDSLGANAIREAWPEPLLRISAEEAQTWPQPLPPRQHGQDPQTQTTSTWALLIDDHERAKDINCVCCISFFLRTSQESPGSPATETLEDVTLHRPATDVWDAWNIGMRLLRAIDAGSGGRICDYTSWRLEDPKRGGYWWDQHRDPGSGGNATVSAVTFAISPQSPSWDVFLCYSRTAADR